MELETLGGGAQERIDELLISACNDRSLAGVAAGIVTDGRVVYAKGFGIADAERGVPITADTSFRIGSISKTFTAIGLMQLHEQERFKLDEPVNNYLKAYKVEQPSASPPVTFRHLLTHTSGIGELRRLSDLLRPTLGLACKRETSDPARPLRPNPQGGGPAGHQMGICEPRLRDAGPASRGHQRPTVCRIYARSRFCAARNGAHRLSAQRTRASDAGAGLSNAPARVKANPVPRDNSRSGGFGVFKRKRNGQVPCGVAREWRNRYRADPDAGDARDHDDAALSARLAPGGRWPRLHDRPRRRHADRRARRRMAGIHVLDASGAGPWRGRRGVHQHHDSAARRARARVDPPRTGCRRAGAREADP